MANHILMPVYQALYNEAFDYGDFEKRMKMQKAVYLLQEMGVPMGEYGFRWYLHGPYSQELQDDMYEEHHRTHKDGQVLSDYQKELDRLHKALNEDRHTAYSDTEWAECMGSMHYLQKHDLSSKAAKKIVTAKLKECKDHLNNDAANEAAFDVLEVLFNV